MYKNFRNLAIGLAVLIAASAYAYSTITTSNRENKSAEALDKARFECLQEGNNAINDIGFNICMRYRGYDVEIYE